MGTSNSYGGPGGGTPLIPSWLGGSGGGMGPDGGAPPAPQPAPPAGPQPQSAPQPVPQPAPQPQAGPLPTTAPAPVPAAPSLPAIPAAAAGDRFSAARNNLSRFARSGGSNRRSLGRAVSNYVSTASGGSRTAAERMGASRAVGSSLVGFLSNAAANGATQALRALNLENLAGQPIEQIFLGLADYICPDGGTIDEGIARDAFIETIAELAEDGITNIDGLTPDQMQTIFELYATHAIEARLCNDIGTKSITMPADASAAASVQSQLLDFIRRGVSDALTRARTAMQALTPDRVLSFVTGIYEQAFAILQSMGDAEAETP
jgi:hypothetical protein